MILLSSTERHQNINFNTLEFTNDDDCLDRAKEP